MAYRDRYASPCTFAILSFVGCKTFWHHIVNTMASLIGRVGGGSFTINLALDLMGYYSKDQVGSTFYTK